MRSEISKLNGIRCSTKHGTVKIIKIINNKVVRGAWKRDGCVFGRWRAGALGFFLQVVNFPP